jgi:hypothetical protein
LGLLKRMRGEAAAGVAILAHIATLTRAVIGLERGLHVHLTNLFGCGILNRALDEKYEVAELMIE